MTVFQKKTWKISDILIKIVHLSHKQLHEKEKSCELYTKFHIHAY